MKRRHRYALNLLSLGLLVFALYLNFVRKESSDERPDITRETTLKSTAANHQKSTGLSATTSTEILVLK